MIQSPKYYVRRVECWGGVYQWTVRDSERRRDVGAVYKLERSAIERCDKLNRDYERFLKASASQHYVGYGKQGDA